MSVSTMNHFSTTARELFQAPARRFVCEVHGWRDMSCLEPPWNYRAVDGTLNALQTISLLELRLNSRAAYGDEIYRSSVYLSISFISGVRADRVIAVERRDGHSWTAILV